ncbi:MAG TPA: hypothetical protein DEA91_15515 [Paenibacillus sp.]|nr:hypothetical protein [Paenibacillus sp.]
MIYKTVQDSIDSLNSDGVWITYDANTNTTKITKHRRFRNRLKMLIVLILQRSGNSRIQQLNVLEPARIIFLPGLTVV